MKYVLMVLGVFIYSQFAFAITPYLSFQAYDNKTESLYMNIVTPTLHGRAFIRNGTDVFRLRNMTLNNMFTLKVKVPCVNLSRKRTILIWQAKGVSIEGGVPVQKCERKAYIIKNGNKCIVEMNGNTLWRTALMLTKINKMTVYQNMYALYLENKSSFSGEDISKLMVNELKCPSAETFSVISPMHAKHLFQEAMDFRKTKTVR